MPKTRIYYEKEAVGSNFDGVANEAKLNEQ